jgi:hypothetical protein
VVCVWNGCVDAPQPRLVIGYICIYPYIYAPIRPHHNHNPPATLAPHRVPAPLSCIPIPVDRHDTTQTSKDGRPPLRAPQPQPLLAPGPRSHPLPRAHAPGNPHLALVLALIRPFQPVLVAQTKHGGRAGM